MGILFKDGEQDYVLQDGEMSVWITINNISVYIVRTDEGVAVDLYPLHEEAEGDPIASTYAFFTEAESDDPDR